MDAIKTVDFTEEAKKVDYEFPVEDQGKARHAEPPKGDIFGDEDAEGVQYKVLSWQYDLWFSILIYNPELKSPQKMRNRSVTAQTVVEPANQASDARPDDLARGAITALRHRHPGSDTVRS